MLKRQSTKQKPRKKFLREYELVFSKNHECSSGNRQKHYASYSVLKLLQKRSEGYTTAISWNPTFLNDTSCFLDVLTNLPRR